MKSPGSLSRYRPTDITVPRGRDRRLWLLVSAPLLLFWVLPLLALGLRTSPAHLLENLRQPQVAQAVAISLRTTGISLLVTVVFGTPVAYLLSLPGLPFRRLLDTLIDLPSVLPPAVAGVALLLVFGRRGLVGEPLAALGLQIAFTQAAVVMAQTFVAAPFYIKAAALGFASVEPELVQAAALDGASNWQILRYVSIPLSWSALVSGGALTWARALGEFGATIIFAGNLPGSTQTMPLAIYIGFELDLDLAITLSVILVLASFLALLVIKAFVRDS